MRTIIAVLCASGLIVFVSIQHARANPTGGSVVGGGANATIAGQGTALTTINQSANQVIINWQNFSIGAGEVTRFVQPSATAAALNRVVSGNPSQIYGSLQANGRVFVINPNGILVGPSGQIDTKGFVASTLDVPDASFMSGANLILSGNSTASVRNEGSIQAVGGDVYLIAHSVDNDGVINAPQGTVGLAAGSQIQLVQSGAEHLSVLAGNSSAPAAAVGVNNSGTIQAASAELKAAGGNIYALAINNGGVVRATGIVNKGGHIYLSATGGNIQNRGTLAANNADGSGGTIVVDGGHNATAPATVINSGTIEARGDAAGTRGGTVEILGDNIALTEDATVDVSGESGGGTALVGGDSQGLNPAVPDAQQTTVDAGATIAANALINGNGGKVVVWADDITVFGGQIAARGGAASGNGGSAEVSGRQNLLITGHADLTAPNGVAGGLLLDPGSVSIVSGANTAPPVTLDTFNDGWINAQLGLGTLTISTANANNANPEDLTVNGSAAISWNNANSFNLIGNNSITVGGTIANAGSGALTLTSGGAIAINNDLTAGSVVVHSTAASGTGISFGSGVTVSADSQTYWAGNGSGSATADLTTHTPTFDNQAATATPLSFTYRQDGTIADADLPTVTHFGPVSAHAAPTSYTIESDNGSVTVSTASKMGGSALTLFANQALAINAALNGANSLVSLNATGNGITLNASGATSIQTSAGQTYNGPVTLSQDTTLADSGGQNITFSSTVDGAHALEVDTAGNEIFNGVVGGGTVLASLTTDGSGTVSGQAQFNMTAPGGARPAGVNAGSVTINDTAVFNVAASTATQPSVQTSSGQNYNGAVSLTAGTVLKNTGGQAITFASTIDGAQALEVDTSGNEVFNGVVGGATPIASLTTDGSGTVGGQAQFNMTAPGGVNPAGVNAGSVIVNDTAVMNVTGSSGTAPSVQTSAGQSYNGAVTLNAATILKDTAAQNIAFASTINGAHSLEVDTAGNEVFDGVIGGSTVLASLTTDGSGAVGGQAQFNMTAPGGARPAGVNAGSVTVNDTAVMNVSGSSGTAPSVQTSGGQTYNGMVALSKNTVFKDTGSQNILFALTINGAQSLEADTGGNEIFNGVVGGTTPLTSLTTDGSGSAGGQAQFNMPAPGGLNPAGVNAGSVTVNDTAVMNVAGSGVAAPSVQTSGGQSYNGAVSLSAGTVLEDTGGQAITFASTVDGAQALEADTSGNEVFGGVVGGATPLLSLTTDGSGTVGGQARFNMTAPGGVNPAGINAGSVTVNDTAVFNVSASSAANPSVQTTAGQTYNGAVTLSKNTVLEDVGSQNILFASTINGGQSLEADTAGNEVFDGVVGGTAALTSLKTDGSGTVGGAAQFNMAAPGGPNPAGVNAGSVTINDGAVMNVSGTTAAKPSVQTSSGQTYNGAMTLNANTVLKDTGNQNILLGSTVDGGQTLEVDTGGGETLSGAIGSLTPLAGLTLNGGTISLNGIVTVNSLGTVDLVSPGNIAINVDITAGTLTVHSGTDGTGNISFGPGVTIDANTQSYQAGDGTGGGGTTATADLVDNAPVFDNYSSSGAPATFTFRQDASITAGEVPLIVPTATYTIESDDGSVQLPGLNLPGNLNVTADGPITQTGGLQVGGTATFAAGVANDITLDNPANDFNNVVVTSGDNVTFYDVNSITFGPLVSTITGNFTVVAGGDLFGSYIVGGTVSISVGGHNNGSLSSSLANLSQVEIPVPRLDTTTFSAAAISLDQAAKILPPGSIGTLWLQIPFPPVTEKHYRIEDVSKWTSGPLAAAGSTSGPQVPR